MVIHGDKLRWLFWLRWKMFIRGFTRDKSRIISTIFMVLFGLPFYGGVAVGTFFLYRYLPAPANAEALFLVLTGVYLLWLILPLLEFTVNEGLDVSKLRLFPLTRWELMASLLFSTVLDIPMFGLLLVFLAVIIGWAISIPVTLFTILAVLVFYTQIVGMSQLVLAILMRTLQSRRFRDLSIILIALFSSSCYLFQQLVINGIGNGNFLSALKSGVFSSYLQWLPPGMTARAIQQASTGNWGTAFLWLVFSLVASFVVLYFWQLVLDRSLSTPEVGGGARVRKKAQREAAVSSVPVSSSAVAPATPWEHIFSVQTISVAIKEFKYLWRDPQLKILLLQPLIYIFIFVAGPLLGTSGNRYGASGMSSLLFSIPLVVFLSMFMLSFNTLGMERQSLTTLFLFPVDPRRLLFGKNLAVALIGTIELVAITLFGAIVKQDWTYVAPLLAVGFAGIGVVLGCGNITSVFFPQRMRQMQRGFQATGASSNNIGCLRGLMSLVMMLVTVIVLLPVGAALFLPLWWHMQWTWVFSIPAALLYGILFHQGVTRLIAPYIIKRGPEILDVLVKE